MSITLEQRDFIKENLRENQDYGYVPKINNPLLFKGGAEKICMILNLSIKINLVQYTNDFVLVECKLFNKENQEVINCFGSAETSETKMLIKDFDGKVIGNKGNNQILKYAQKRAFVGAVLMYSGLSSGFSIEEENDVEDNEQAKTETNLHKKHTNPLDKIKELESKINGVKHLKELKSINEKYQHEIVSLGLSNLVSQKRKELWDAWFNDFITKLEKCETTQDIEEIKVKYKWLIESNDYKNLCVKLINEMMKTVK